MKKTLEELTLISTQISSKFVVAKACLPETLVRSTTLILGSEAASALQSKIENQDIQIPSAATISRTRVKMDASWQSCGLF